MRSFRFAAFLCFLVLCTGSALAADPPQDKRKHTKLEKYVTSVEAHDMWHKAPAKVILVDVRTEAEYSFLGHPPMAANVPSMLWTGKFDAQRKPTRWCPMSSLWST